MERLTKEKDELWKSYLGITGCFPSFHFGSSPSGALPRMQWWLESLKALGGCLHLPRTPSRLRTKGSFCRGNSYGSAGFRRSVAKEGVLGGETSGWQPKGV